MIVKIEKSKTCLDNLKDEIDTKQVLCVSLDIKKELNF